MVPMSSLQSQGLLRPRIPNIVGCVSVAILLVSDFSLASALAQNDITDTENVEFEHFHLQKKFHQSGFGGIYNINHPAGARARRKLSETKVIIPKSAVPHAIPSMSEENILNLHGHYVHDEHRSPFSSFLYDRPKEELEAEQKDYEDRMKKIREEWGAWDFNDEHPEIRPIADFNKTPYKDMDNSKFPSKAWQMDEKYVKDFIAEAKKLVDRVREAIYAEYGHPTKELKTPEEIEARNKLFEIHITDEPKKPNTADGWAYINKEGFEMYAKKLLHSMVTNDEFYYVMGGHSAAAGHGNHFHQTYLMDFANIMEPVLHKLGVRLIARNMGMGGLGTIHYSLASGSLYGETDVLMWDSSMTEKSHELQDVFHKAGLLSGERLPILISGAVNNLSEETGGNLWYADLMPGHSGVPLNVDLDQAETLPFAVQNFICEKGAQGVCNRGMADQCWVPRSDVEPSVKQLPHVGGKASWHPGWREHRYTGRKQVMLMLKALDKSLEMWEDGIKEKGFPLKEEYWHIGNTYESVRTTFTTYINGEGKDKSPCENIMKKLFGLERACRMPIKGMTEHTPKNLGEANGIIRYLKAAPNGYVPSNPIKPLYEGVDVLPPIWKVPEGQIDVHAIAIASTYSEPELDYSWTDKKDTSTESAENSRHMLRGLATEPIVSTSSVTGTTKVSNTLKTDERSLITYSDDVVPGLGWHYDERGGVTGYCDGSPMSTCKRAATNDCLLYGHNDGRGLLQGDGLSGWLVFTLPELKEGLVFIKAFDWEPRSSGPIVNILTKDWTEVNNGTTDDGGRRNLRKKAVIPSWPADMMIDVAVNGKIVKTYPVAEYDPYRTPITYMEAFYPMLDDKSIAGTNVEIGFRLRSEENPRDAGISITHIYYA